MSRERDILQWIDHEGRHGTRRKRPSGLGDIPRELHMVDCYCRSGHLVAVVAQNGDGDPLLIIAGDRGAGSPMLVITRQGLAGAMVRDGQVHAVPTSRDEFAVACEQCRADYVVEGIQIEAAVQGFSGKPRRVRLDRERPTAL